MRRLLELPGLQGLRRFVRPWMVIAVAGLLAVGVVEVVAGSGPAGYLLGALGALVGVILLPMATQLGLLAGSFVFGLRVRHIVFGAMRALGSWTVGRVTITLRALPVTIGSEIGPWRKPVILRCWLAGLVSALTGIGIVVVSWLLADGPFGRGFVLAATPLMLYKLWPRRVPLATSTGWLLFGLPRMPEPKRTEFCAGPMAARAYEALREGDLDRAQAVTDELTAEHPELNTTVSCRVSMHEARGEYAQAVMMLLQHISAADIPPREMSYTLAGMAGLGFAAVEAGQLPADDLLPLSKKALDDAVKLGFPPFDLSGTRGLLALVEGDVDEAARLAAVGSDHNTSPLARADCYATLARAHMAQHDNAAAREALTKAEELAAWWPRVRETRARLQVS
ncbi:tetratricopeptide repeat protein [Saccharopolyspora erythraea]|uniref:Tetratricopeptide repeat protein n=2 Tax=Saccharopolyspora erythraea TaxID=1836 RepID=A4FMW1_SACEN|nr:hypothetical protein [Saccharopolyspora erythraea]EQD84422.1 hypothetical protein N599_20150 [Saccharopolyspora erythraea D]QRK88995.1 hypothetical protein JQX30_31115 [Saccharopolyspora erythraea]CAM05386.1 hypothetical protein SACE_6213 [Saccharopolyspora erythraea NRRL 2338]